MNTKTTKFLAVLAVLAVAFAGVAVLAQEQANDADDITATTAATYDTDYKSTAGISKIQLEDVDGAKSVVLYEPATKTTPATPIVAGCAYYINADATVVVPDTLWENGRFVFFILNGVQVTFVTADPLPANPVNWHDSVGLQFINVASEENGVITLDSSRAGDNAFYKDGYAGKPITATGDGWTQAEHDEFKSYKAIDRFLAVGQEDYSVVITADNRDTTKFIYGPLAILNITSDCTVTGEIEMVNFLISDVTVTFVDFTGTIANAREDPTSTITVTDFTGAVKYVEEMRTPDAEHSPYPALEIVSCEAGVIEETSEGGLFVLDDGVSIFFAETATLGGAFGYVDEYNDMHFAEGSAPMTVGMDGLTIYAGNNMIGFDGTLVLEANEDLQFTGNVTLSGMVYSNGKNLSLENITVDPKDATKKMPADIKLGSFQVTDSTSAPGKVTLKTSVLVQAGCSFYVSGGLEIADGAVLKIAEGSVVKPEGELKIAAPTDTAESTTNGGSIWNAGQFIAKNYDNAGVYFDKQLIRVFMNTGYQTGTFYLGSSVYDGTVSAGANDKAQTPLTVAFGSYIDMTGIDKVNLTSGGINVNSPLYKYNTLILATFDNTIALTASFDNQYPVTVALDGKASATPVFTAKSATFRNVVWQSPISATLYVTAPEVYTVVLAKTLVEDSDPAEADEVWTKDLTITDQNGRVIPISTADETKGQIQVVFGYEYTIQGANSTSNYKFISPNKDLTDLTKVSKTKGTFTMIRNNVNVDDNGKEVPVVLQITEGIATTLTVNLTDTYGKFSEGDVFLYYALADEDLEPIGEFTAVSVQLDGTSKIGVIENIYSNDTLLFKSEFVKFFAATAYAMDNGKVIFPTHEEDVDPADPDYDPEHPTRDVADPVPVPSDEYADWGFKFEAPAATATSMKAFFKLEYAPDTVEVTFQFGEHTAVNQRIIVEFTDYCGLTDIHKEVETYVKAENATEFTATMCIGEVFNITWTEVDGYLSKMTYTDEEIPEPETDKEYFYGTDVAVKDGMATIYTLTEEELAYITVVNQTEQDLTLTIGKFASDIAKGKSNTKVIVNDDDNTLVLSKKGWTVEGWTFQIYTGASDSTVDPTLFKTVYVSGPQTTQTFEEFNADAGNPEKGGVDGNVIKKIIITMADINMTRYFVNVKADDHGAIDPFDQTGYMDEVRKAYVTTQYGYNVVDVIYEYQEVDMTEKAYGHATKGYTPEGQEVWTYIMPASNVLLIPVIEKETRELSFVDQNGELIEPTQKVAPRTEVFMPVPCWPLSEITDVTTEAEIDFEVDANGYISFVMPDEDVVFVVTCQEIDYSKNVLVTIGQRGAAIALVITALDGKMIASGSITMYVNYTYEEDGEVWTDAVEVTVEYESDGHSHGVILDETFIEEIGEYYDGAFAVTGSYELGYAVGEMSKTVYTPVLGA